MQQSGNKPSNLMTAMLSKANIQSAKQDNSWDYIKTISINVRDHIFQINQVIVEAIKMFDENQCFTGEAKVLIEGIQSDIEQFATNWRVLFTQHENKTGFGQSTEEHSLILNTGLEYIQNSEVFMNRTSLAVARVQELVTELEYRLRGIITTLDQVPIHNLSTDVVINSETPFLNTNI